MRIQNAGLEREEQKGQYGMTDYDIQMRYGKVNGIL